jgi:multidrug efflux pump subunit AcrA (membrane-fusion protein)
MNLIGALLVAVLIGAVLPLQGLINARLGLHVGGALPAAFVSFLVGTVMLGLYLLATRTPVTLGRQVGDQAIVLEGLQGGERLIVDGQQRIADGAVVQVRGAADSTMNAGAKP